MIRPVIGMVEQSGERVRPSCGRVRGRRSGDGAPLLDGGVPGRVVGSLPVAVAGPNTLLKASRRLTVEPVDYPAIPESSQPPADSATLASLQHTLTYIEFMAGL